MIAIGHRGRDSVHFQSAFLLDLGSNDQSIELSEWYMGYSTNKLNRE